MLAFNHHRKKITKRDKKHPFFDKMIYFIALVGPIMTIPQIINVWTNKNPEGVSIYTWGSYFIINIIWFYYGYVHRDKTIMFAYTLWMIANGLVVAGLVLKLI